MSGSGSTGPLFDDADTQSTTESELPAFAYSRGDRPAAAPPARWRLRNWRLRTKFTALLLVPVSLAVVLGAARVVTAAGDATRLSQQQAQVDLGARAAEVTHALQRERHLLAAFLATDEPAQRPAVDAQILVVTDAVDTLLAEAPDRDALTPEVRAAYDDAAGALESLAALRVEVLQPGPAAEIAISRYGVRIAALLRLSRAASAAVDPSLQGGSQVAEALAAAKEEVSLQHAVLLTSALGGEVQPAKQEQLRASVIRFQSARATFREAAEPAIYRLYQSTVVGPAVFDRSRLLSRALNLVEAGFPAAIPPAEWDVAAGEIAELIRRVEGEVLAELGTDSGALSDEARSDAIRDGVVIGLLVLLTLALLVAVARSVLRPLATLRSSAFDIAVRQLPAEVDNIQAAEGRAADLDVMPVPVHTREDIGEVARAFDAVHRQALRLAGEQATLRANISDMFANLSRRSQGLVERQLGLIDQLESGERDPDQLAQLFRLDHLATRMRRYNENLLVLAGVEQRRRTGGSVPVFDVLRAAAGEIEDYRRVHVRPQSVVSVNGPVVDDLVHLIAELLDNATAYSPPTSRVVLGNALRQDGCLLVEVSDEGIGLSAGQLEQINARLAEPPRVDVSIARKMGLFVVGRLASRHSMDVRLTSSEVSGGVTALVTVPAALVSRGRPERSDASQPARAQTAITATTPAYDAPAAAPRVRGADILFGAQPPAGVDEAATPLFEEAVSAWFRAQQQPAGASRAAPSGGSGRLPEQDWGAAAAEDAIVAQTLRNGEAAVERTAAGLPKRRPGALLVPGAAAASASAGPPAAADRPSRSAEAVRSRLAGYQRGTRQGRHAVRVPEERAAPGDDR